MSGETSGRVWGDLLVLMPQKTRMRNERESRKRMCDRAGGGLAGGGRDLEGDESGG